ncbi:hypothetical protein OTU49_013647, partial [Cherax quadricarinatus]
GEKWDFVLQADHKKSGAFWMSFMGGLDCENLKAHQFALLVYDEQDDVDDLTLPSNMPPKPEYTVVPPPGLQVNTFNRACYDDLICVADLRSPYPLPEDIKINKADITLYLAFSINFVDNKNYYSIKYYDINSVSEDQQVTTPQINNISNVLPATPLIMSGKTNSQKFCNVDNPPANNSCYGDYCECLHMYKIPLGSIVDLVLIDEGINGPDNHPVHLHGQSYWVLGQNRPNDVPNASITRDQVIQMAKNGELVRNFDHPVVKDTVTIPNGG